MVAASSCGTAKPRSDPGPRRSADSRSVQGSLAVSPGAFGNVTPLAVFGILEIEAASGVPFRALVAVGGDAAGVFEHPGQVQQVPGHERGVAVGEVVVRAARTRIEVGRTRAGLADPAGVGLRRNRVTQVLK